MGAWGWTLPVSEQSQQSPPRPHQPQHSIQSQLQPEQKSTEGPSTPADPLRAKVLSDWGCISSAEEGIPPSVVATQHHAGRETFAGRATCQSSWEAVADCLHIEFKPAHLAR